MKGDKVVEVFKVYANLFLFLQTKGNLTTVSRIAPMEIEVTFIPCMSGFNWS